MKTLISVITVQMANIIKWLSNQEEKIVHIKSTFSQWNHLVILDELSSAEDATAAYNRANKHYFTIHFSYYKFGIPHYIITYVSKKKKCFNNSRHIKHPVLCEIKRKIINETRHPLNPNKPKSEPHLTVHLNTQRLSRGCHHPFPLPRIECGSHRLHIIYLSSQNQMAVENLIKRTGLQWTACVPLKCMSSFQSCPYYSS